MARRPTGSSSISTTRRRFVSGAASLGASAAIVGAAASTPTTGIAATRQTTPSDELEIVIGTLGEANTINPFLIGNDTESDWRTTQLFDSVVRIDPATYEPVPGLASEWTIDGLVFTFTIREALFSDGTPLTANDVAFTLLGVLHPDTGSPLASNYTVIEGATAYAEGTADTVSGIEVVDDRTLVVTLAEPNAAFLYNMHLIKPVPAAQLEGRNLADDPWFQSPVGAGAFQFESWTTGGDFVMTANPNFWEEGKPAIQRVIHRTIADSQSLVLALESGEIDGSNYPNPAAAEELRAIPALDVIVAPFTYPDGSLFNCDHEHLSKKEVRQAIAMAIDTERFAQDFLLGLGEAGVGPIAPENWAFDPSLEPLPYDPDTARQMIIDAGAEGAQIRMMTNSGNILREDWVTFCQQALQDIGIEIIPELIEYATLVERVTTTRDYEICAVPFIGVTVEPSDLYLQLHSESPSNYANYRNPELDTLLEQARRTIDQEEAKPIYAEIQRIVVDEVPFHGAWYRPFLYVVNKEKFASYTPSTIDFGLFYDLWNWTAAP